MNLALIELKSHYDNDVEVLGISWESNLKSLKDCKSRYHFYKNHGIYYLEDFDSDAPKSYSISSTLGETKIYQS